MTLYIYNQKDIVAGRVSYDHYIHFERSVSSFFKYLLRYSVFLFGVKVSYFTLVNIHENTRVYSVATGTKSKGVSHLCYQPFTVCFHKLRSMYICTLKRPTGCSYNFFLADKMLLSQSFDFL